MYQMSFRNEFNEFNNTGARILDFIYYIKHQQYHPSSECQADRIQIVCKCYTKNVSGKNRFNVNCVEQNQQAVYMSGPLLNIYA